MSIDIFHFTNIFKFEIFNYRMKKEGIGKRISISKVNKNFIYAFVMFLIVIFFIDGVLGQSAAGFKDDDITTWVAQQDMSAFTYRARMLTQLDKLQKENEKLSTEIAKLTNSADRDKLYEFIYKYTRVGPPDTFNPIFNKLNAEQAREFWDKVPSMENDKREKAYTQQKAWGELSEDNKKKLLTAFSSEKDSAKRDKYFTDLWKSLQKDGKVDEATLRSINELLKPEAMKDIKASFIAAVLRGRFETKNKEKKIAFKGFGHKDVELTAEGDIKLPGGRIIKPDDIISSASEVVLGDDGKTLTYTLSFAGSDKKITITDSGDGYMSDRGYVNGDGKTLGPGYPFGKGNENLRIEYKDDTNGKRNVFTLTGEGRSAQWEDRNAVRFVRRDEQGKPIPEGTYFIRAHYQTGEISFSIDGTNSKIKNEGSEYFDVLIPDKYDPDKPLPGDVLKSSYSVGAGTSVMFADTPISSATSLPTGLSNYIMIGKDSAYISATTPVVVKSFIGDSLAKGIFADKNMIYVGSDGREWIRIAENSAYYQRAGSTGGSVTAAGASGTPRYGAVPMSACGPGGCRPPSGQQGQQSGGSGIPGTPGSDPTAPGGGIPVPGVTGAPGTTGPGGLIPGMQAGLVGQNWVQTLQQQGQIGSQQGDPSQPGGNVEDGNDGGCGPGGCEGDGGGRRGGRFPIIRAVFRGIGRIFGIFGRR